MSLRNEQLSPSEAIIDKDRLAELLQIEYRHTGYLKAAEQVSLLQHAAIKARDDSKLEAERTYWIGYLAALRDAADMSVRMIQQVIDAHPEHDGVHPPRIRKGQLCLYRQRGCMCLAINRGTRR